MSAKRKKEWANFKEQTSKKRMGKREDGMPTDYITVQRLSSSVEGKCQKYSRIGPLTIVPLEKEPTLENIKDAFRYANGMRLARGGTRSFVYGRCTDKKLETDPHSLH